jgi:hypothetical protein
VTPTRVDGRQVGAAPEGTAETLPDLESFSRDDLLAGTDPFGPSVLDRSVRQFLDGLTALGDDLGGGLGASELAALLAAAGAVVASAEAVRAWRRRRAGAGTPLAGSSPDDDGDASLNGVRAPEPMATGRPLRPDNFSLR